MILSIISLIVALGALGFSFFTYFAHDRELKRHNSGKAIAYNVKVYWLNDDDESTFLHDDISNLGTLTPHNPRKFSISLNYGHYETMNLRYTWTDDYQEDNVYQENLQL